MSEIQAQQIINLLTQQNEVINAIYISILFVIGVASAVFVLLLLYKFLCLFF